MMQINRTMPMAEVIHLNYLLLQVMARFDIRLGFGNQTVEEVCRNHNVNPEFFLEIVNSYHDPEYFPDKELQHFRLALIVSYLKKTHSYYLDVKIPEIESLILSLVNNSGIENKEKLMLLDRFFKEYKQELIAHVEREENRVMPYVLEIEDAYLSGSANEKMLQKIKSYSIDDFADEHDNMEVKLFDLKNIIIKFLPPVKNIVVCENILTELFRLEKDLNNHARIEDKVLIAKVREMEEAILGRAKQK
jgi:regulator of cell morphogenesis and NO signaling